MSSSNFCPLNEFITLQRGFDLPAKDRVNGEVPVVASTGIAGYHNEVKVHAPGVVIGRSGSIGGGQYLTQDFWPLNTTLWVKDFKGHHPRFVYYLLRSINFNKFNTGTGVPTLNRNHLSALEVLELDLDTERRIANILGAIDDKIALNNKINQTLEQISQAIFKSWFVDFEPVKAKISALAAGGSEEDALLAAMQAISGKDKAQLTQLQTDNPEHYNQLRTTAELFPSALEDSELGDIPEGWEITTFGKVSSCFDKMRVPLSKKQREKKKGDIPYYGATSVMGYVDDYLFDDVFLLIGEDGSVLRADGTPFVQYIWGKSWVNNHAHVLQGKNGISTEQLMAFIKTQNIIPYVTGAVQLKLNQKNMNSIPFIKAPNALNVKFSQIVEPLYSIYRKNAEQTSTLSQQRDYMLPKLLSGELDINQN